MSSYPSKAFLDVAKFADSAGTFMAPHHLPNGHPSAASREGLEQGGDMKVWLGCSAAVQPMIWSLLV